MLRAGGIRMTATGAAAKAEARNQASWRTPAVVVTCGCCDRHALAFGPRSALGFFLTPMSAANGWGRDVFALAFALQSLLYGAGATVSPARWRIASGRGG